MKSIKTKLVLGILLILSILLAGILTYSVTFKNYFQKEKLSEMEHVISSLEDTIKTGELLKLDSIIIDISEKYNVQIEIDNINTGKTLCSTYRNGKNNMMMGNGMGGMNKNETLESLGTSNGIDREIIHDKSSGVDFLTTVKENNEIGYKITVRIPINIMDDAVDKSLRLLMIIFIPITIIVLIITLLFSNAFTKPIIEIRRKTSRIKDLDFSSSLEVKGKDEIADLANCVNNLSNKIESTLRDLNSKNLKLKELIENERENEIVRKEFVSSVSHELKSPIAVISGYAQALSQGIITSKEDIDYYISVIDEEAERMQVIVNDLLDLYKLESNTFKLEFNNINLDKLVSNIVRKNSLRFEEQNIKVEYSIDEAIVIADGIRLEQAIQNYINNALSHIDEKKELRINVKNIDNKVRVSVYNSGKNIEDSNLERIWQGFVRIDKVRNYKEKRVGLGLAIVKQIIKLHEGTCGIENKEGGVEFWIELNRYVN